MLLTVDHISVYYGAVQAIRDVSFIVGKGEIVTLIGANGAGKSVLMRMILGQEQPDAGEIKIGPSISIGHYAQEHETLDFNQTVVDAVRYAGEMSESRATAFLLHYLFTYKQVSQKIGELSGGERSRLQLALVVLSGANFLLLDEPTNHLDIPSQEVLESVLDDYKGTILLITHDRYLVDAIATQIWEIDTDESHLIIFKGIYSQLKEEREKDLARRTAAQAEREEAEARKKEAPKAKAVNTQEDKKKKAKKLELEKKIATLEAKLSEISEKLAHPPKDAGEVVKLAKEYDLTQKDMDATLAEREGLQ